MMVRKLYMKNEVNSENREVIKYGFRYNKTDKVYNYMLIGCESQDVCENIKLFNFRSNKFSKREIEKRDFKITGWSFMTLVKKTTFSKSRAYIRC